MGFEHRLDDHGYGSAIADAGRPAPGKRSLTDRMAGGGEAAAHEAFVPSGPRLAEPPMSSDISFLDSILGTLAPGFGASFEGVRIHGGEVGEARARAHGAPAVAEGNDIYCGAAITPDAPDARRIVAHEMAHVLQQRGGDGPPAAPDALEREAHRVGDLVAAGGSARPRLHSGGAVAQGYGSPEHQDMADTVHGVLEPDGKRNSKFGGVSNAERADMIRQEHTHPGVSHSPGFRSSAEPGVLGANSGVVEVPHLARMLRDDPFHDRQRSLTISARNYENRTDAMGPYLAIETDPATHKEVRYDVPMSPGDLTALNGDLYSSMDAMRKAPVEELVGLQTILAREAAWERKVASDPFTTTFEKEPDFDDEYEKATAWRQKRVYAEGKDLGPQGAAAGGDTRGYSKLAEGNDAHFSQPTPKRPTLEVTAPSLERVADGRVGNYASGNQPAWEQGHARALLLARESHALRTAPGSKAATDAASDRFGHERGVPVTGRLDGDAKLTGSDAPLGADHRLLRRHSDVVTAESKANDAYAENAGADHFLTDAFAAGHLVSRSVINRVTEELITETGYEEFLAEVAVRIQEAAIEDNSNLTGELKDLRMASRKRYTGTGGAIAAMVLLPGTGFLAGLGGFFGGNAAAKHYARKEVVAILRERLPPGSNKLRAVGAKLVHDYYNDRGMIVHNRKGMTFFVRGDGGADHAPEARRIGALAVLESRNHITEMIRDGKTSTAPMSVWDYAPALDATAFTETSGRAAIRSMLSNGAEMWALVKKYFSFKSSDDGGPSQPVGFDENTEARHPWDDFGDRPMQAWFKKRAAYIKAQAERMRAGRL